MMEIIAEMTKEEVIRMGIAMIMQPDLYLTVLLVGAGGLITLGVAVYLHRWVEVRRLNAATVALTVPMAEEYEHTGFCMGSYEPEFCADCFAIKDCVDLMDKEIDEKLNERKPGFYA